jgi:hypothetical protein
MYTILFLEYIYAILFACEQLRYFLQLLCTKSVLYLQLFDRTHIYSKLKLVKML